MKNKTVKLRNPLQEVDQEKKPIDTDTELDRYALLVYEGTFDSMFGRVTISKDDLMKLVGTHNSKLARLKSRNGDIPICNYPPIQLDHSFSAKDTVGRLIGTLELGTYQLEDTDEEVPAIYGTCRILGAENTVKVRDGRWSNLSISANLEKGTLDELTITPFPAAEYAVMLSKKRSGARVLRSKRTDEGLISLEKSKEGKIEIYCGNDVLFKDFKTEAESVRFFDRFLKEKGKLNMSQPTKGELKKYLTDKKKMSDKEADEHLAKCNEDEDKMKKLVDEYTKATDKEDEADLSGDEDEDKEKLSSDEDEDKENLSSDEDEDKEKLSSDEDEDKENLSENKDADLSKKLSRFKTNLSKITKDWNKDINDVRVSLRKTRVLAKLSALRSEAKITPAEIKKIDIASLCAKDDAVIDEILKTYQDRQPVIMTGAYGSSKEKNVSDVFRQARLSQLEMETRKNMSLLKNTVKEENKSDSSVMSLSALNQGMMVDEEMLAKEVNEIFKLMDSGKIKEAQEKIKGHLSKTFAGADINNQDIENQITSLSSSLSSLEKRFSQVTKLLSGLV